MTAEILRFYPQMQRGDLWLDAFHRAAAVSKVAVTASTTYIGTSDWLVIWGPGAPNRWPAMTAHQAQGKHVACFDAGYWNRTRTVRLSIDAAHPSAWVMRRPLPVTRWRASPAPVRDVWREKGPIMIAGIGPKALEQYGASRVADWERTMIDHAVATGRRVLYRRKRWEAMQPALPKGVQEVAQVAIDRVLVNTSLVITWHSNVAVDAIRNGIPVICQDGAAAAVYGSEWNADLQPISSAVRAEFLANLAWFQWEPKDAPACWRFLREQEWAA
jgi:hypothetical protein